MIRSTSACIMSVSIDSRIAAPSDIGWWWFEVYHGVCHTAISHGVFLRSTRARSERSHCAWMLASVKSAYEHSMMKWTGPASKEYQRKESEPESAWLFGYRSL